MSEHCICGAPLEAFAPEPYTWWCRVCDEYTLIYPRVIPRWF